MTIPLPYPALVVLIGASSSGKTTFARKHFTLTEVVSSDELRGRLADDENAMHVNRETFAILHAMVATRLRLRKTCVVDATNLLREYRAPLVALARGAGIPAIAVVLNIGASVIRERFRHRPERRLRWRGLENQFTQLRDGLGGIPDEGFAAVYMLRSPEEVDAVVIERVT